GHRVLGNLSSRIHSEHDNINQVNVFRHLRCSRKNRWTNTRLVEEHDIESYVLIDDRPTTWKQRIVTRGQLRPDRCDREVTTPAGRDAAEFLSTVPLGDVLLISDYGKGVCTKRLLSILVVRAREANVPILELWRNTRRFGRADRIARNGVVCGAKPRGFVHQPSEHSPATNVVCSLQSLALLASGSSGHGVPHASVTVVQSSRLARSPQT
ncbi:MAG: hypothetical protein CMJ64_23445, partial [Planctomycetaceae bacterium]|nr:hypothetical protein [Planctomycetaceae bacterium]